MAKIIKQIGVIAYRDPETGDFLSPEPIYIQVEADNINKKTGLTPIEKDTAKSFADNLSYLYRSETGGGVDSGYEPGGTHDKAF